MKHYMSETPLSVNDWQIEFCLEVTPQRLDVVFEKLMNPPGRGYVVCFSDDFCVSARGENGVSTYNLDISKCDASHGPAIFDQLIEIAPGEIRHSFETLVDQLKKPARIHSVSDRSDMVLVQNKHPYLYSGSTITTLINTLATGGIAIKIAQMNATEGDQMREAALAMGYKITGWTEEERCKIPEEIQFLKHSPVMTVTGKYSSCLNLGVLLRTSGVCKRDLPGRGDLEARARAFQKALVQGMYSGLSFDLIDRMRLQVCDAADVKVEIPYFAREEYTRARFDMYELTKRYGLNDAEIDELMELGNAKYGDVLRGTVFDKIFHIDYGYPLTK